MKKDKIVITLLFYVDNILTLKIKPISEVPEGCNLKITSTKRRVKIQTRKLRQITYL